MPVTAAFKFRMSFQTNLVSHIRWFEFLSGPKFARDRNKRYESRSLITIRKAVRDVVKSEIYDVGDGPDTGNIRRSVTTVSTGQGDDGGVAAYFDPNISGATGTNDSPADPSWSYAAFFERTEFNSYLLGPGRDIYNPKKYRPFHGVMESAVADNATIQAVKATLASIRSHKPNKVKIKS